MSRVPTLGGKAIIMGDFNTFFKITIGDHSEDGNGEDQVAELRQIFFDASYHIPHPFTPFPHDSLVTRLGTFVDTKLDHAFLYPNENFIQNCEVVSTKESRESDHYMLKVTLP
jgi:endonuclease/exonuclease/phosphatase family metal-dependent hydrolase